jgi:diguanylate cyclase (GGDEF)-like protein
VNLLAKTFGFERTDARVRAELARTVHARPIGLLVSAACGVATGSVVLVTSTNAVLRWFAIAMIVLAALRVVVAYGASSNRWGKNSQQTFGYAALAYAATCGTAAAVALTSAADGHLQLLLVGYAMTLGAGIVVGNAARPLIAVGQMVLTFLPICVACFSLGTPAMVVLGLILPCLAAGLTLVTFSVFNSLAKQVRAATESAALARRMREQARTDAVTGLLNRPGFEAAAKAMIAKAAHDEQLALFWLDLRRFKEVNDMLGHHTGDLVLAEVARRLTERLPEKALCARFGSDEFLLLASLPNQPEIERLAARLCADMALPLRIDGQRIEGGIAVGIATIGDHASELNQLMQQAGLALYHAKVAGRNQTRFFDTTMTRNLARRKELESELRGAIQRDELSLYFQPILDLATGRIRCFEALVRWFHPVKGELSPSEFIPVAEETGLIITLGNWITRSAARACANWPQDVTLAVNLSPVQISAPGAALGILSALKEARLDPRRLELEVTESLFVEDKPETALFMQQLADEGVRFSLDDFGTGYSSLHYINKYPFSTIKVDRSFVSGPNIGRRSEAIIRAVAEMGATLDMEIVAEGLETAEQVAAVRRAGCTLGQGYHFSRAVPEHLALRLLEDERKTNGANLKAG